MRALRLLIVTVPLLLACKQEGGTANGTPTTSEPQSGGYNPGNDSRAHAGLPSQAPLPPLKVDLGATLGDLGQASPPPPPSQKDTPAPKGKAGGTLR